MSAIYFTQEHEAFRKTVRLFMEKEVAPFAAEWEEKRKIPRQIYRRMGEQGMLGISFPEELGGTGADFFYSICFLEEMARSRMGGFCAAVTVQEYIATGAIFHLGSDELKQKYLIPSIRGEKVGAIAISEPDTGSDVASIRTTAVREGDYYRINGAKTWITNGVDGDFIVIACKTDPEAGAAGISLIVADTSTPGITARAIKKMGWHCSDTAELSFVDVKVPISNLVGEENQGFYAILQTFVQERLATSATAVGGSVVVLEDTLKYMESRQAFGKPLAKFQALRHRLADLYAELEAVRQLVYHTTWLHTQGKPAMKESAMAKMLSTELSKKIADECLQFHGGFGYTDEYEVSRFYRDARVTTIVAGTTEIMREIIAKAEVDHVVFPASVKERQGENKSRQKPDNSTLGASSNRDERSTGMATLMGAQSGPWTIETSMRSLPQRLRPERVQGLSTRVHFLFKGSRHPEWTVAIDSGRCEVGEGLVGSPNCVVQSTEEVYLNIELGKQDPQTAFLFRKIKVSNVGEMTKFTKAFRRVDPSVVTE